MYYLFAFSQIDKSNVTSLTDHQLENYLSALGDKIAVKQKFSEERKRPSRPLRNKMSRDTSTRKCSGSSDEDSGSKGPSTRKLNLGWIHEGKQMWNKNGGGTRSIYLEKTANKESILQKGKDLFFPNGISKLALLSEVECDIVDFSEAPFPETKTVGNMYENVKMGILRFYLTTVFNSEDRPTHAQTACTKRKIGNRKVV